MTAKILRQPWMFTPDQFIGRVLFHGSGEHWHFAAPTVSGYDNCFWTAQNPAIAQVYIPQWPGYKIIPSIQNMSSYELNSAVRPSKDSIFTEIATTLGAEYEDVSYDFRGEAKSWRSVGKQVTKRDCYVYLDSLGYTVDGDMIKVKTISYERADGTTSFNKVVSNSAINRGRLVMVELGDDVKCDDIFGGEEGSLLDPQYHKVKSFAQSHSRGNDIVKIGDHCQSESWGNVGHDSFGFSQAAITRLYEAGRVVSIPAAAYDFKKTCTEKFTPEFLDWHFSSVVRAIALGEEVPLAVIESHKERLIEWFDKKSDWPVEISIEIHPVEEINLRSKMYRMLDPNDSLYSETAQRHYDSIKRGECRPASAVVKLRSGDRLTENRALKAAITKHGVPLMLNTTLQKDDGEEYSVAELQARCRELGFDPLIGNELQIAV